MRARSRSSSPVRTSRQEEILRCVRLAITDQGDAPTVSEIAEQVGLRPSSVHYQLAGPAGAA
ncbi:MULTISPECIES: hypothetical protein [Streptomyces]|uniref:LexA repressor DNA-binding domain-containing protein n=1 Tax=Streptomyces flaveolus TaxID=67297 RepID=A0ABV1VUW4_9ACTN